MKVVFRLDVRSRATSDILWQPLFIPILRVKLPTFQSAGYPVAFESRALLFVLKSPTGKPFRNHAPCRIATGIVPLYSLNFERSTKIGRSIPLRIDCVKFSDPQSGSSFDDSACVD